MAQNAGEADEDLLFVLGMNPEAVGPGDVLVADREQPGRLALARVEADPGVVGIVAGEPGVLLGSASSASPEAHAAIALPGTAVLCKVDAGYGSLRVGDLLTTSPTPGHAMRSDELAPGTILGKALEPLESGTGLIRVLVMLR